MLLTRSDVFEPLREVVVYMSNFLSDPAKPSRQCHVSASGLKADPP